ncbi:P-selectin glycoprotein ligand 1 [Balearica regulorum gibbericeps]|uniref:P-selectin glycoprotein ligand 1 n=1 Tax=Balearica regulorum gibbericeps TaxID=100784 RepID=UPI003F63344F
MPRRLLQKHSRSSSPASPSPPGSAAQAEGGTRRPSALGIRRAPGPPSCPRAGAARPSLVMPAGAAARGPAASPRRGPMAPGRAVLVMLVILVLALSTLRACGAMPLPELRQHRGVQWVWGAARRVQDEALPLSRRKRADDEQQPSTTAATPGHGLAATPMAGSNDTDFTEPVPLLGSAPPPAPSTNASLHWVLAVPTTAEPLDETESPEPDPLLGSAPPAAPSTNASLQHRALAVPTTAEPLDETESPDPDLLWAQHSTRAAPQTSSTTTPSRLTSPGEEGTVADSTDSNSSAELHSAAPPALGPTATGYKKVKKAGATPTPTPPTPWDTKPGGTTVPVGTLSRVMGKCLLAILLLALVAATFMVCTGVLGALLWRRTRTAHRRLSHTEMVCISSLLPDGEVVANGPKPGPARRQKLLLEGGTEADGDNLTLSSFLPEHS